MIRASVSYTKNHLSALLIQVKAGETVEITDRDRPVARITPVSSFSPSQRLRELAKLGLVRLPVGGPMKPDDFCPITLEGGGHGGVVDALIEERREGR